ncbi:hypothetical protein ACRAWF_25675 [Streptomyces sp. L7]
MCRAVMLPHDPLKEARKADSNERYGAAPEPEQPADRSPAQAAWRWADGRRRQRVVAGLAGEFGAELVRAIRLGLAEVSSSGLGSRVRRS